MSTPSQLSDSYRGLVHRIERRFYIFRVRRAYRAILYLSATESGDALQTLNIQMQYSLFPEPNGGLGYPYIGIGTYNGDTRAISFDIEWDSKFRFAGWVSPDFRAITGTLTHDTFNIVNPVTFETDM